jgi:MFS family permease
VWSVLTRNPDFRRLFISQLVLFGGDWFVLIPLLTLLPKLTGSGLWGGLTLAADMALLALLLPYAGTLADRFDRRKIMLAANLVSIAVVAALLLVRSAGTAWIAIVAVGLIAVAKAFYTPAAGAALPNTVPPEDLPTANALAGSAWGTMLVVGASLGGLVSAAVGPYACFVMTVGCLLMSAWLVWRIRGPLQAVGPLGSERGAQPFAAIREALRYIGGHPRVAALVTVKSAVGLGNGALVAFPLLATTVYGIGEMGTGLLFAARGLGALIGPLLFGWVLTRERWLLPSLALSMAMFSVAYLGVAATTAFWVALLLVAVAHLAGGGNWVVSNFALQTEVPDGLRGRVLAADMMIATLAIAVSQLVAGAFVDRVSPRVVIAAAAAVTLTYAVVWRVVTLRLMRRAPSAAGTGTAPESRDLGKLGPEYGP